MRFWICISNCTKNLIRCCVSMAVKVTFLFKSTRKRATLSLRCTRPATENSAMSPPSITPADCALLLAVPITEGAFMDDLASPVKDYAAHIARSTPGASKAFLWDRYCEVAGFIDRIANEVAAYGV